MFEFKKNREVKRKLVRYVDDALRAVDAFSKGTEAYGSGGFDALPPWHEAVRGLERDCDAHRYAVEREMFEKALLPESREDILILIESLDLVVNQAEEALRKLLLERIVLPQAIRPDFDTLCQDSVACAAMVFELARDALATGRFDRDREAEVRRTESRADLYEQKITETLFASDLGLAEKMHFRDAAACVARICDMAEDAANALAIFVVKRSI